MSTKHTPGPWHWVNSRTDEPFNFNSPWDGDGYPDLRTVATFGDNKVEVVDGKTYSSFALPKWILTAEPMQNGNDVANARLIAAAPELLMALQLALPALEYLRKQFPRSEHDDSIDALAVSKAVISKATGEPQ